MTNMDGAEAWDPREPEGLATECDYCGLPVEDGECPGCGPVGMNEEVHIENFETGMEGIWNERE